MGDLFHWLFQILATLLTAFYAPFHNYLIAIILLTVFIMAITYPLTAKQTRSMIAMNQLQPEIKRLQELHKDDKQKAMQEQMMLYKKHGVSPWGGCLPLLLQWPLLIVMLAVLRGLTHVTYEPGVANGIANATNALVHGAKIPVEATPKYISHGSAMYHDLVASSGQMMVWGFDLASKAVDYALISAQAIPFYILIVLSAASQLIATRQIYARNKKMATTNPQSQQMMKMQYFFVVIFAYFSLQFEAAVLVYWVCQGFLRIFQQWAMYKYDRKLVTLVGEMSKEIEEDIKHDTEAMKLSKRVTPKQSGNKKKKRKGR